MEKEAVIHIYHRWQTQGPQAESGPLPCFIRPGILFLPLFLLQGNIDTLYIYIIYNGILLSYKKEQNLAIFDNIDGPIC